MQVNKVSQYKTPVDDTYFNKHVNQLYEKEIKSCDSIIDRIYLF